MGELGELQFELKDGVFRMANGILLIRYRLDGRNRGEGEESKISRYLWKRKTDRKPPDRKN